MANNEKQNFDVRLILKDKVYLKADDCADALGYDTKEDFKRENRDIISTIEGIDVVLERTFNNLLVKNPTAFSKQAHLEMTEISTLNAEINTAMEFYGLKLAMARPMFEAKAREKGCESVEEYIQRYDYPEQAKKILKEFRKTKNRNEDYNREVGLLRDKRVFVPEVLERCELCIQAFTIIENNSLKLVAFLAGNSFFYQLSLYDEYAEYYMNANNEMVETKEEADHVDVWYGDERYAEMHVNPKGDVCIPTYQESSNEIVDKVIGRTAEPRDFRKYNVFENINWAIQHSSRDHHSREAASYEGPGISISWLEDSFLVNMLYHNDEYIVVDGIVDCDEKTQITCIKGLTALYHD